MQVCFCGFGLDMFGLWTSFLFVPIFSHARQASPAGCSASARHSVLPCQKLSKQNGQPNETANIQMYPNVSAWGNLQPVGLEEAGDFYCWKEFFQDTSLWETFIIDPNMWWSNPRTRHDLAHPLLTRIMSWMHRFTKQTLSISPE